MAVELEDNANFVEHFSKEEICIEEELLLEPSPPLPFIFTDSSEECNVDIDIALSVEQVINSSSGVETSMMMQRPKSAIIKHLAQPSFKIRYASDYTLSFSLFAPLTPLGLKNILIQHGSLKFACFHAGIITDQERFNFHDHLSLPSLKKITIKISSENVNKSSSVLSHDFKRLLHLLKQISYGQLECIRLDCESLTAICIPLASAFVPTYELEDSHPLGDLILKNRKSLQSIVIGPNLQEMIIKMNPTSCPGICDPANYPKIENFVCFPDVPLLPSWSIMLRPQKHLSKLTVTLSDGDDDVWSDVCEAIKLSCNSLQSFGFNLMPIDGEGVTIDLKVLKNCTTLKELSLQFEGCNVVGFESLPETITTLHFLGGHLFHSSTELMMLALPNLEEVNVLLGVPLDRITKKKKSVDPINISSLYPEHDDILSAVDSVIVDIVHHPLFYFIKAAPKSLKNFNVECDMGVELDWEILRSTCGLQKEFGLIERSEIGDFSLERKEIVEEQDNQIVMQGRTELGESVEEQVTSSGGGGWHFPCSGVLGL